MGYTLSIGKPILDIDTKNHWISIDVEPVELEDAPAFGEPTDYTNRRWPSYSSWAKFVRFVELEHVFRDEDKGLIRQHPGETPISKWHQEEIDKAMEKFKEKYPNAKAGYSPLIDEANGVWEDPDWPEENNWLCRLEWLKYWVDWALENVETPIFKNT